MTRLFNSFLLLCLLLVTGGIHADTDPLPSWNDGDTKQAIIEFVQEVTKEGGKNYVPPSDRIATFDQDGTLWVEQPMYCEMFFVLDKIREMSSKHPEWKNTEPFKAVISNDIQALEHLTEHDEEILVLASHSNITVDDFHLEVTDWLKKAIHPRYKKPFTELVYQPMLEVMQYFEKNQFRVYIVSGGGQEFMRSFTEKMYGLLPGWVIGTTMVTEYQYHKGHPLLVVSPKVLFINNGPGKVEGINLIIGQRPIAAFGNSSGDQQMLEWTQVTKGKTLELLVHHDDDVREYAYGPNSKIGTFPIALMAEARKEGWLIVSMKNDWKIIFPWDQKKEK